MHDATPAAGFGRADLAFGPADLATFCRRVLIEDPGQFDGVSLIAVDEHVWPDS